MHRKSFDFIEISPVKVCRLSLGHSAKNTDGEYYLKTYRPEDISKKHFQREEGFYQTLGHIEQVMPLLGIQEILGQRFFVFPFIEKDLFDYIGKVDQIRLITEILIPILKSLEKIHDAGYLHADLKAENVRICEGEKLQVYLSDFGKAFKVGAFAPHMISSLSQHTPPDTILSPQIDIYAIGVLAFQLLFGVDFIKKFQMAGRNFENIPESKNFDPHLLHFISVATDPSALHRFKSATQALGFLNGASNLKKLDVESYDIDLYFEFYLECMRAIFLESNRSTVEFEEFIGPWGEKYYERLKRWSSKQSHLVHLRFGSDLIGICEATIKEDGVGIISSIFLSKKYRGQGGAQALESSAIKFFLDNGAEHAMLNVTEGNERAINFYRKNGWVKSTENSYPGAIQFTKKIKNGGKGGI